MSGQFIKNFDDFINNHILGPIDRALTAATNKLGSLGGGEATVTDSKVAGISFGSFFSFGRDAEPAMEGPSKLGRSANIHMGLVEDHNPEVTVPMTPIDKTHQLGASLLF